MTALRCLRPVLLVAALMGIGLCPRPAPGAESGLALRFQKDSIAVTRDGNPLLVYRYRNVPMKPYVQELYSWNGQNVLRDNVEDHPHHHGLMFAVGVNGTSFWEESEKGGRQIHLSFSGARVDRPGDDPTAEWTENLDWQTPQGETVLTEERTLSVRTIPDIKAVRLAWRSSLRCPGNRPSATLAGEHYYGLGMRFPAAMDEVGRFVNSSNDEGTIFRGEERLMPGEWCAYSVPGESPVTVVMFNSPANPKPCTWFTMKTPFAYLSATLRYHENPVQLQPNDRIHLEYGVAVIDGQADAEQISEWVEKRFYFEED